MQLGWFELNHGATSVQTGAKAGVGGGRGGDGNIAPMLESTADGKGS